MQMVIHGMHAMHRYFDRYCLFNELFACSTARNLLIIGNRSCTCNKMMFAPLPAASLTSSSALACLAKFCQNFVIGEAFHVPCGLQPLLGVTSFTLLSQLPAANWAQATATLLLCVGISRQQILLSSLAPLRLVEWSMNRFPAPRVQCQI